MYVVCSYCVPEGSYTFALNDTALAANRNKRAMVRFSYTMDNGEVVSVDLIGTETVSNIDVNIDPSDDDDEPWYEIAGIVVAIVIAVVVLVYGCCIW